MSGSTHTMPGYDEETSDLSSAEMLRAALPFQRNPALSRIARAATSLQIDDGHTQLATSLGVGVHARLAARLVAAPHEAMEDLRTLGLEQLDARAEADVGVLAVIRSDPEAARMWNEAFELELKRHT